MNENETILKIADNIANWKDFAMEDGVVGVLGDYS